MNHLHGFAMVAILAAIAAFAAPAQAQQAAAVSNPLDSSSDVSTWSYGGYPFSWSVDATPVQGHAGGNSFNWNDGTDIDDQNDYWCDGYAQSGSFNVSGLDDPELSFWCRAELPNENNYYGYRDFYMWDENFNYYVYFSVGPSGYDLNCGTSGQWHQHIVPIPPEIVAEGTLQIYFYTYWELWWETTGADGWFIDDINILVADVTPPDAIADLAASNATETEIQLDWTSPFDDDISGVAASFDLRYSTTPITDANFSAATQVDGEPAPDVEGSAHSVVVSGLTPDTGYYFAVQTTDIAGNVSLISNVAPLQTLAPPPPPPAPAQKSSGVEEVKVDEDILPCSAGTSGAPTGVLALAGLIALAAIAGILKK